MLNHIDNFLLLVHMNKAFKCLFLPGGNVSLLFSCSGIEGMVLPRSSKLVFIVILLRHSHTAHGYLSF